MANNFDDYGDSDGGSRGSNGVSSSTVPAAIKNALKPRRPMSSGAAQSATDDASKALDDINEYRNHPAYGPLEDSEDYSTDYSTTSSVAAPIGPEVGPLATNQQRPGLPRSDVSKGAPADNGAEPSASDVSSGVGNLPETPAAPPQAILDAANEPLPHLAQPNKFLSLIQQATGMRGPTPAPGQPYQGPITGAEKAGGLSRFLSRLSGTYEANFGMPLDREFMLRRQELQNEASWHAAMVGINRAKADASQQNADINQQKADQQSQKNDSVMRLRGYLPDQQNPGQYTYMTPDQILADPVLSLDQETKRYANAAKFQQAQLAEAHRLVLTDPSNARYQQLEREIQGRLAIAQQGMRLRMQNQSMAGYGQLLNLGFNGATGEHLGEGSSPVPSWMPTDAAGNPVPLKIYSAIPSQARYRSLQAKTLMPLVNNLEDSLEYLNSKDQLGPIRGRANNFLTGKLKISDPDYQTFMTQWSLLQTALMQAHVGSRGSDAILDHFASLIDGSMPFENSQASLAVIGNYLDNEVGTMAPVASPIHSAVQTHANSGSSKVDDLVRKYGR